ncbi:MAG: hypothetical protein J5658_03740 [Prevotella sp.]|nr:hypothetical protein [Prevotella sp.]
MSTGLIWFICLAPVVVFLAFAVVGWLNYKENPLYWRDQKKMLRKGQVRWMMLTPESGDGHAIAVVKDIQKKKIVFDRFVKRGGKYEMETANVEYSVGDFFRFTDPEPVYKEERV